VVGQRDGFSNEKRAKGTGDLAIAKGQFMSNRVVKLEAVKYTRLHKSENSIDKSIEVSSIRLGNMRILSS
jgi:hypothetical protein